MIDVEWRHGFIHATKQRHKQPPKRAASQFSVKRFLHRNVVLFFNPLKMHMLGINILQHGCHKWCFFLCRPVIHISKGESTPWRCFHTPQVCPCACWCVHVLDICPCLHAEDMSMSHSPVRVPAGVSHSVCWALSTGCCCVNRLVGLPQLAAIKLSPACHWVFNGDQHKTDMKPQVTDNLSLTKAFAADIYDILEIQMENLLILCCVFLFCFFFKYKLSISKGKPQPLESCSTVCISGSGKADFDTQ